MGKLLFLSFILCSLCSALKAQQTSAFIKLEFFKSIPKVIDGCSGTYTYDTASLKNKRYIFISNMQDLGLIKINGKTISLTMVGNRQISKTSWIQVFKGGGYIITLTTKTIKQSGDETSLEIGILEIVFRKTKTIIRIHGEAGC